LVQNYAKTGGNRRTTDYPIPMWKYTDIESLTFNGINIEEDLNRLRNHIMFPVKRPSTLDTIARRAMDQTIPSGSISMANLLDEQSLN